MYLSTKRNYRKGEEHGSAKWGNASQLSKKYADRNKCENIILTQNTRIGLDGRKHRRNLNVLVCGGSGAGKTRFYAKPNIMQANTSFVVLDPKGEILRDTGFMLEKEGYEIRVLDLINTERSHGYNPFVYLRDDKDILKLVANLVRNTTPKGAQSNDPFWERAETALLEALILYLVNEAPPEEQNFPMVMEMISAAEVKEEDEGYTSILDELFNALELRNPDHLALKQYRIFKMAAGKTAKSILISLGVRLEKFNLPQIASVVSHDELNLPSLGDKKTALFAVIPDNDSSLNYIIGMMYTQLCLYQRQGAVSKGFDHTIGDILFRLIRRVGAPVGFLLVHFASVFSFQGAYQRSYSLRFFALRRNMRCNSRVSRSFAKISVNTSLTRCGASLIA